MRKHTYRIGFLDYNFLPHWASVIMSVTGSGVWERIWTCEKISHETWIQQFRFLMLMNNTGSILWILTLFEDLFLAELTSLSDFSFLFFSLLTYKTIKIFLFHKMITYKNIHLALFAEVKQKTKNLLFDLLFRNQEVQIFTCTFPFMNIKFGQ